MAATNGPYRRWRLARICLIALATVALLTVARVPVTRAAASTGIAITTGGCSGGGSVFCFDPEAANGVVGSQVTWTNQSGVAHALARCTAAACPGEPASTGSNTFNVALGAGSGSAASFTFTSAGSYHYYCTIHGYALMHAAITVAAAPSPTPRPSASATPGTERRAAPVAPATGASPGPLGALLALVGAAILLLAVATRRLHDDDRKA